jgi:phosphotransferase system  glucose/maltose/N-acetylglucosamine-specific IIC component
MFAMIYFLGLIFYVSYRHFRLATYGRAEKKKEKKSETLKVRAMFYN